ncbi:MAG: clan AA aspartic protease [candidate division KSB1 bacterium]|nr:clan AA aspartic protease [candidate division KSB1 bacterium]MDZ7303147.1 clan AA aspartic protease [candidate division KSB1 bacterium]MDZ7310127.1 clan AA aspartic protease [candidate division KSB1 bacterium]
MGEVRTKAIVANPIIKDAHPIEVDCLVDTGAVMLMLPKDVVNKLGIAIIGKALVTLANEKPDEMDVAGPVSILIGDRKTHCDCLVGPILGEPLIGQLVLESLDLVVDAQRQLLVPRPESPAYPSYKLK